MTVVPVAVGSGSTGTTFTFTFTNNAGGGKDFVAGSQATILVPSGFTAPTTGNVAVSTGPSPACSAATLGTITGTTIPIDMTCLNGQQFTVTFSGVTAPVTTGNYQFTTQTKISGGTLTEGTVASATFLVTVNRGANGGFTANLSITPLLPGGAASASFSPSSLVFASSDNTLTSTLTITTSNTTPAGATSFTVIATNSTSAPDNAGGSGTLTVNAHATPTPTPTPTPTATATPTPTPTPTPGQGCTPGFWKGNADKKGANAWGAPVTTKLSDVFAIPSCLAGCAENYGSMTLRGALSLQGGKTLCQKAEILYRAAAAAYLNAVSGCVQYPLSAGSIVAEVNQATSDACAAANSGDTAGAITIIINEATRLDGFNNVGCPISQEGVCSNARLDDLPSPVRGDIWRHIFGTGVRQIIYLLG